MSILIKGMEMPISCFNCDFGILYKTHLSWLKRSAEEGE